MKTANLFYELYKKQNLIDTYHNKISHKASPGIDKVNKLNFDNNLDYYTTEIESKIKNESYKFIAYKEKLILKGKGKNPRVISIPVIRDKLVLNILNEILTSIFNLKTKLTQNIIDDLKTSINSNKYNYFIKIDIQAFYDNINHRILMNKIMKKTKRKKILSLIKKAIENPTMVGGGNKIKNIKGVPQGISISNILANIYLEDADKKFSKKKNIEYFRYVDDILILCNEKDVKKIKELIKREFNTNLLLNINEKKDEGYLTKGFDYLGYKYTLLDPKHNKFGFSIKRNNLLQLENSLIKIFSDYKRDKKDKIFIWKLNLRITGFRLEKRKCGWLFFYSQIDDVSKLYHLDWFINEKLCNMYNVKPSIQRRIKKFITAYFEIIKKRGKSIYIPSYDSFTIEDKKKILINIFEFKAETVETLSEEQIDEAFKNKIYISIKDLEKDVQSIS